MTWISNTELVAFWFAHKSIITIIITLLNLINY